MKPEKFINLLVFLVATGMLVWGICGNAGWKLLGANLLTAVFFMFLYRKDDNHPGVFPLPSGMRHWLWLLPMQGL